MLTWLGVALLATLQVASSPSDLSRIVYLGLLERGGSRAGEENEGNPPFPRVRAAFQVEHGDWRVIHPEATDQKALAASPDWYPSPVRWNAVSDGHRVGELVSARPEEVRSYAAIGLQVLVSSSLPDSVGVTRRREPKYAFWPGMATFRPLVLVTSSFWKDPEGWQRFTPPSESLALAFDDLRKLFRGGVPVTFEEGGETEVSSFRCSQRSLKLARAYRSKDGREVLSVELEGCAPPADSGIDYPITYAVLRDGGIIKALGSDLQLIDAGDYDGDGGAEVVFGRSLHNADSYVLFSRRFEKRCDFSWGYH